MRRDALAIAALATTLAATALAAGPVVLEERAIIPSPDPSFQRFPLSVATDGNNWIIAVGKRTRSEQDPEDYRELTEAVGTSLRVHVGGNLLLEATDSSHAAGKYGLAMYKTAATFDDFLAWEP